MSGSDIVQELRDKPVLDRVVTGAAIGGIFGKQYALWGALVAASLPELVQTTEPASEVQPQTQT